MAKGNTDYRYLEYLASCIRNGDHEAFAELYDQTYDMLYRYVHYFLRDPDQIHDALQEIYISIYKNISSLRLDRLFLAWIRQIAYHVCCDMAEEKKRRQDMFLPMTTDEYDLQDYAVHSESEAYRAVYDRDTQTYLQQMLKPCTLKERQAFTLQYRYGLKLEEIADFMGVSLSSVKRYIASARETLRKRLSSGMAAK